MSAMTSAERNRRWRNGIADSRSEAARKVAAKRLVWAAQDQSWRERAACKGKPTAIFFPDPADPADEAKKVCSSCEAKDACLAFAVATNQDNGVWGGMGELERRRERRRLLREARNRG